MQDDENIFYKIKNLFNSLNNKLNKMEMENRWKNISIIISIWIYIIIIFSAIHSWEKFYIYGIHFDFFVYDINFLITRVVYLLKFIFVLCLMYLSKYLGNNKIDFGLKIIYFIFFSTVFLGMGIFKQDYSIKFKVPLYINNTYFLLVYIYFLYNLFFKIEIKKKSKRLKWILIISFIVFIITEVSYIFQFIYVPKTEYAILKEENEEKIILFKASDSIFVADFKIDDNNNKDESDDICTIYTKNYEIKKYENIKVENRTFKDVIIDKENLKKPNKNDEIKQEVTTENKIDTTTQTTTEKTIGEQTKSTTENLTEETQKQDKREEIENGQNPT